jgi:hypothetical protein
MNENLRDRIIRHLEPLSDERGYQVLDYIEFLESKYAAPTASTQSLFERFTEGVEDTLRAGRVSTTAISETMGLLNKAVGVLTGVAAAGKSVASDIVGAAGKVAGTGESPATRPTPPSASAPPEPPPPPTVVAPEPPPPPQAAPKPPPPPRKPAPADPSGSAQ